MYNTNLAPLKTVNKRIHLHPSSDVDKFAEVFFPNLKERVELFGFKIKHLGFNIVQAAGNWDHQARFTTNNGTQLTLDWVIEQTPEIQTLFIYLGPDTVLDLPGKIKEMVKDDKNFVVVAFGGRDMTIKSAKALKVLVEETKPGVKVYCFIEHPKENERFFNGEQADGFLGSLS